MFSEMFKIARPDKLWINGLIIIFDIAESGY